MNQVDVKDTYETLAWTQFKLLEHWFVNVVKWICGEELVQLFPVVNLQRSETYLLSLLKTTHYVLYSHYLLISAWYRNLIT